MRRLAAAVVLAGACACVGAGEPAEPPNPSELVRPGAMVTIVRRADLDGDGRPELAVASVTQRDDGLAAPHLEVFGEADDGWVRMFDAERAAPPGAEDAPPTMIAPSEGFVAQSVHVLETARLDDRPGAELVAGIASAGATAGPLELWILTVDPGGRFSTAFRAATARGGRVTVRGDRVLFEVPIYRRNDPGCCPTFLEHQTIAFHPDLGVITVVDRRRERL